MTQSKDDLSERLPADVLQRYQERTRYFDEVAARRGSSAVVIGRFEPLRGQSPTERELAVLQFGISVAEPALSDEGWAQRHPGWRQFRLPTNRQRKAGTRHLSAVTPAEDAEDAARGGLTPVA